MNQETRSRFILKNDIREVPNDMVILDGTVLSDYPLWSNRGVNVACPVCGLERFVWVATLNQTGRTACVECVKFINNNTIWYGDRFGKLTVIGFDGIYKRNRRYICECECGEVTTIWASSIHRGARSCGCDRVVHSGSDHFAWKGDDHPRSELYLLRRNSAYARPRREWFSTSRECERCGSEDKINAHHMWHVSTYPEKAHDFSQAVPLCEDCHVEFHGTFPTGNHYPCTPDDYYKWIQKEGAEMYDWDWSDLFVNKPEPGHEREAWDWSEVFMDMGGPSHGPCEKVTMVNAPFGQDSTAYAFGGTINSHCRCGQGCDK